MRNASLLAIPIGVTRSWTCYMFKV